MPHLFTEAGVIAMRNRLRRFMGSTTHSVRICTFHGFCAETIARFPEYFSESRFAPYQTPLRKFAFFKKYYRIQTSKYLLLPPIPFIFWEIFCLAFQNSNEKDFLQTISSKLFSKKEDFEEIPDEEKTNPKTGQWKKKHLDRAEAYWKWQELARVYEQYEVAMHKEGFMDFDDQILFVLHALRTEKDFVVSVQEETLFLLADEFQDSNGAQMEIIERIAGNENRPIFLRLEMTTNLFIAFRSEFRKYYSIFYEIFYSDHYSHDRELSQYQRNFSTLRNRSLNTANERLTTAFPEISKQIVSATNKTGIVPEVFLFSTSETERFFLLQKFKNSDNREILSQKLPCSCVQIVKDKNFSAFWRKRSSRSLCFSE